MGLGPGGELFGTAPPPLQVVHAPAVAETRAAPAATRSSPPPPVQKPPPPPPPVLVAAVVKEEPLAPVSFPAIAASVARLSAPLVPDVPSMCHARAKSDLGGELVADVQQGPLNTQPDAGACCASCVSAAEKGCNVWVFHTQTHECWLKRAALYPERPYVWRGESSPWVGGSLFDYGPAWNARNASLLAAAAGVAPTGGVAPKTCIHTVLTSNGNSCAPSQRGGSRLPSLLTPPAQT